MSDGRHSTTRKPTVVLIGRPAHYSASPYLTADQLCVTNSIFNSLCPQPQRTTTIPSPWSTSVVDLHTGTHLDFKMAPKKAATAAPKTAKQSSKTKAVADEQSNGVTKATARTATKKTVTVKKTEITKKATTSASKDAGKKEAAPKKTATTTKKAATKPTAVEKSTASKKRKADEDVDHEEPKANTSKRRKGDTKSVSPEPPSKHAATAAKKPKVVKPKVIINHAPTQRLDIYVSGEGSQGELGLGAGKGSMNAFKPRLNPRLSAADVGVVQLATGGMHCVALTYDNKILTWGVNDDGALGRDTQWDGGMVDIDDKKSDTSSEDAELNPKEATPAPAEFIDLPEGIAFTQVAAGDSSTFALTDEGQVYGWGTFRVSPSLSLHTNLTDTDNTSL